MSKQRFNNNNVSEQKWGDVGDYDDEPGQHNNILERSNSSNNNNHNNNINNKDIQNTILSISKVDNKGIKIIVELGINEKGEKIKITRKVKVITKTIKLNRRVLARRKWNKFGDCKNAAPGPEQNVTYQSFEVIHLDLRPKKREEEKEESGLDKLQTGTSIVVCRNCGETGHWTLKCPKRAELAPGGAAAAAKAKEAAAAAAAGGAAPADAGGNSQDERGGASKYVPLHMRGAGSAGGDRRGVSSLGARGGDDTHTLRVTNLSEDVSENDLQDLFRRFGHTSRIYLAKDRNTGLSRGFAFINYTTRLDAQNAIDKLDGHGYDNLILHVEWAKQREEREGGGDREERSTGGGRDREDRR